MTDREVSYPLAPLIAASGLGSSACRRAVQASGSSWQRALELGASEEQADRWSVRLGLVPWLVWDNWAEDVQEGYYLKCAAPDCDERFLRSGKRKYCSPRCRHRRYRQQPGPRAVINARRRAFYREVAEYERARYRAFYQEHAEAERARGRAYKQRQKASRLSVTVELVTEREVAA